MSKTHNALLFQTFAQVLETMAFISLAPVESPGKAPSKPLLVSISFTGRDEGVVEMVASDDFAVFLAANVLGSSSADADVVYRAGDAIKELVNVVCGAILAKRDPTPARNFELSIPALATFDAAAQWDAFVGSPDSAVFDADGHTIAIRFRGAA